MRGVGIRMLTTVLCLMALSVAQAEILFIPKRDPAQEMWTGRKPSFEEASGVSGIRDVRAAETFPTGGSSPSAGDAHRNTARANRL